MHVDVLEFDAASHTGVDDIKELFEGVAYAPVQGRYKVYIIDEVHMLSKQAFNALLKTLEEPPEHVVFIFATTEVNKIPVTVLSRCMRFDLRRISAQTLFELYTDILKQEKIDFEEPAIHLVARAADGSARDGLSLLDQAIAMAEGTITVDQVAKMLGLADRNRVVALAEQLLAADIENVMSFYDELYELGQDPLQLITELLEFTHLLTRIKIVPNITSDLTLTELEKERAVPLAEKTSLDALSRVYQALLTAANEAKTADRPHEAVLMALVRISHLASLPPLSNLLQNANAGEQPVKKPVEPKPQPEVMAAPTPAPVAEVKVEETPSAPIEETTSTPASWKELITRVDESEPSLAAALSQQAMCTGLDDTNLKVSIKNGLHSADDLHKRLQNFVRQFGWQVELQGHSQEAVGETLNQASEREHQDRLSAAAETDEFKQIQAVFPDAKVESVKST
jgi:DNA polymerase-3 subunit gamma/tau